MLSFALESSSESDSEDSCGVEAGSDSSVSSLRSISWSSDGRQRGVWPTLARGALLRLQPCASDALVAEVADIHTVDGLLPAVLRTKAAPTRAGREAQKEAAIYALRFPSLVSSLFEDAFSGRHLAAATLAVSESLPSPVSVLSAPGFVKDDLQLKREAAERYSAFFHGTIYLSTFQLPFVHKVNVDAESDDELADLRPDELSAASRLPIIIRRASEQRKLELQLSTISQLRETRRRLATDAPSADCSLDGDRMLARYLAHRCQADDASKHFDFVPNGLVTFAQFQQLICQWLAIESFDTSALRRVFELLATGQLPVSAPPTFTDINVDGMFVAYEQVFNGWQLAHFREYDDDAFVSQRMPAATLLRHLALCKLRQAAATLQIEERFPADSRLPVAVSMDTDSDSDSDSDLDGWWAFLPPTAAKAAVSKDADSVEAMKKAKTSKRKSKKKKTVRKRKKIKDSQKRIVSEKKRCKLKGDCSKDKGKGTVQRGGHCAAKTRSRKHVKAVGSKRRFESRAKRSSKRKHTFAASASFSQLQRTRSKSLKPDRSKVKLKARKRVAPRKAVTPLVDDLKSDAFPESFESRGKKRRSHRKKSSRKSGLLKTSPTPVAALRLATVADECYSQRLDLEDSDLESELMRAPKRRRPLALRISEECQFGSCSSLPLATGFGLDFDSTSLISPSLSGGSPVLGELLTPKRHALKSSSAKKHVRRHTGPVLRGDALESILMPVFSAPIQRSKKGRRGALRKAHSCERFSALPLDSSMILDSASSPSLRRTVSGPRRAARQLSEVKLADILEARETVARIKASTRRRSQASQ